jgi:fumarylacetoacetase
VEEAGDHIFGFLLVNDWSARDIQSWEYVPLGPFLGKNFATTVSPWVVTAEALSTFREPGPTQDPPPLPYLSLAGDRAYDIQLQVCIETDGPGPPYVISRSNSRHLYWSFEQQLAHHTVNGCNMRSGDLLASGTISGPTPDSYGSLLELTWRGEHPIELPDGERRTFLEDGDRVILSAWAQGDGYRVGFGEASGRILPAHVRG